MEFNPIWWHTYKLTCHHKERFDTRFCNHPDNRFGPCEPFVCPIVKQLRGGTSWYTPKEEPEYYRVISELLINGTLPTATYDKCEGCLDVEGILDLLLPEHEDCVAVSRMRITPKRKK